MELTSQVAVHECPEANLSTFALDGDGRFCIIGARKSIYLIDLNTNPNDSNAYSIPSAIDGDINNTLTLQKFPRSSKWDPTSCNFNKNIKDLYALSAYQNAEIFSISDLSKPKIVLRGHSRFINDLEWSQFDPNVIGTSSADCLTNLWDIRDNRRPTTILSSVSGATHIRFSKTLCNLLATSHEIDVRIWDIRQPSLPLHYIASHLQKINGMDWNPSSLDESLELLTCSQDSTLKLWNLAASRMKPEAIFMTRIPIWRVRYLPSSKNLILTTSLPQLKFRDKCSNLDLWSLRADSSGQRSLNALTSLVGHSDVIIDFDWRLRENCELVSWSRDKTVRVWSIDHQFIELATEEESYHKSQNSPLEATNTSDLPKPTNISNSDTPSKDLSKSDSDESERDASSVELKQEFSLINRNIPNIEFEELNFLRRICLVTARFRNINCRLRIALPPNYPQSEPPTFTIVESTENSHINEQEKRKLVSILNETAKAQLGKSKSCIEVCLRKFVASLQKLATNYKRSSNTSSLEFKDDAITLSIRNDQFVPFPRTSGGRFCGNKLIVFRRPMFNSSLLPIEESSSLLVDTPRSMAQLSTQLDNLRRQGAYNLNTISISYFYYGAMRKAELQNRAKASSIKQSKNVAIRSRANLPAQSISRNLRSGPIYIYDLSDAEGGVSRYLAENYVFDKQVIKMCQKNIEVAAQANRQDLIQIWSLALLSLEGMLQPFSPENSWPWTKHPFGRKLIQSLIDYFIKNCRDVQTAAMLIWTFTCPKLHQQANEKNQFNSFEKDENLKNDLILHFYTEILYRLNLLNQRAMILKNIGTQSAYPELFNCYSKSAQEKLSNVIIMCRNESCQNKCQAAQCSKCKDYSLYCSICQLPVRGSSSVCTKCLHGGHITHYNSWFSNQDFCPTGCGCKCLY